MPDAIPHTDVSTAPPGEATPCSVPRTLGTYLWCAWFGLVGLAATIPLSLIQALTHAFVPTARNFKRWAGLWARLILRGTGLRVRTEVQAPLDPEQPYVFVANHQNALDILVLAGHLPAPFGFVAKAELARVPFLGFAIRQSASLFIDRSEPRRSLESIQRAGARIRAGNSVLIFPEGARSWRRPLLPFMKGAFVLAVEAGVPLVPITICDAYEHMDERYLVGRPGTIRFVVGRPISMAGLRRRDVPAIMAEVRGVIQATLAATEEQP